MLPQGGLIHWGCCLKCFYDLVPPWAINCVEMWTWGWGAPCIVGSRSRVLMLCFSSDAWGFGFVVFDRTRVWASFWRLEE